MLVCDNSHLATSNNCKTFCISRSDNANATALDSVMGLGGNAIKINAYEMDFAFDKNSMSIDFGVTAAGCVPVIETVRGMIDGGKENTFPRFILSILRFFMYYS